MKNVEVIKYAYLYFSNVTCNSNYKFEWAKRTVLDLKCSFRALWAHQDLVSVDAILLMYN